MKTLGGCIFIHNAINQDYHIVESVNCLKDLCDKIVVLDAGSTDGTAPLLMPLEDEKTTVIYCSTSEWQKHQGREKLSFFTNLAASFLTTDYYFNLQADECISELCFPAIREAIEKGYEGLYVKRINLWGDSQHQLEVPFERSPVGTEIVRLAKVGYQSIDDAESIACRHATYEYLDKIRIYHTGFIRDNVKHLVKIRHMQDDVFQIGHDKRIDGMTKFDPSVFFSVEDVVLIKEALPIFIQKWCYERDKMNSI